MASDVDGYVEKGFEGVRDAFLRNFAEHGDVGASVALLVDGRPVVDLWGGVADPASGRPYNADTVQVVFSTTKGATALCGHLLAQRGLLDIDAPVARYWPEFADAGKGDIPVRWLLSHQAALPTIDPVLSFEEAMAWDPVVSALAAQAPLWEPGTAHGYHSHTYGWLVGELVRRISGQSLGSFFASQVAQPLGLDFWIGLPESEEHRVAPVVDEHLLSIDGSDPAVRASLPWRVMSMNGVFADGGVFNTRALHAAELGAAGGITNARAVARLYAAIIGTVDGGPAEPLLTPEQVEIARAPQSVGKDQVLSMAGMEIETAVGLGFWPASAAAPFGGKQGFGHPGAGGSVGFADPENGVGFGYAMNKVVFGAPDPRSGLLVRAAYDAIGVEPAFG